MGIFDELKDKSITEADDYGFEENNSILDMMSSLVHMRDNDDGDIPSYSFITPITDTFGLDDIDVIKLAKENGYKMFRVIVDDPEADIQGGLVIADPKVTAKQIEADFENSYEEKVDVKEFGKTKEDKDESVITEQDKNFPDVFYVTDEGEVIDCGSDHSKYDIQHGGVDSDGLGINAKKYGWVKVRMRTFMNSIITYGGMTDSQMPTMTKVIEEMKTDGNGRLDISDAKSDEHKSLNLRKLSVDGVLASILSLSVNESLSEPRVISSRGLYDEDFHSIKIANNKNTDEYKKSPLPVDIIPNNMGINLGNVKNIEYNRQKDGQLKDLTIHFIPEKGIKESIPDFDVKDNADKWLKSHPEYYSTGWHDFKYDTGDTVSTADIYKHGNAVGRLEYDPKTGKKVDNHNQVVEPKVDEKIEKHDTLNPALWDNDKKEMIPEVRDKLLEIANTFVDSVKDDDIDLDVNDIVLIGSNANYNYTDDSDLDIHIIASSKPDCNKKHLDKIYQAYKTIYNSKYDMTVKGYPAEVYVEMDKVQAQSGGIYSIKDGKWLKEPKQFEIPDYDKDEFDKEFSKWEDRYFDLTQDEKKSDDPEIGDADVVRCDVPAVMEDAESYDVIKTRKWYDPEGLDIPNPDARVLFTGDYDSAVKYLKNKHSLLQQEYADRKDIDVDDIKQGKTPNSDWFEVYFESAISKNYYSIVPSQKLKEDTKKIKDGKWVNKGAEGTHGSFKTKKAADAQRKAMFANGWKK